jgi:hypothetical protein
MESSNPRTNTSTSNGCAELLGEYKDAVARLSPALIRSTVDSWSIKDADVLALERFLERYPRNVVVLDIGTFFGVSAFHFARQPKVSEVVSVDLNPSMAELYEWLGEWDVPLGPGPPPDATLLDLVGAALAHFPEQRRKVRLQAGTVGSLEAPVPPDGGRSRWPAGSAETVGSVGVPVPPDGASLVAFVDGDHAQESVRADLETIFGKDPHAIAILHDCRGYHGLSVLAGVESFVGAARTKYRFRLFERLGPGLDGLDPPNLGIVYAEAAAAEIEQALAGLLVEDPTLSFLEVASAAWRGLSRQRERADRQQARADRQQARADRQRRRAERLEAELQEARRPWWHRVFR